MRRFVGVLSTHMCNWFQIRFADDERDNVVCWPCGFLKASAPTFKRKLITWGEIGHMNKNYRMRQCTVSLDKLVPNGLHQALGMWWWLGCKCLKEVSSRFPRDVKALDGNEELYELSPLRLEACDLFRPVTSGVCAPALF